MGIWSIVYRDNDKKQFIYFSVQSIITTTDGSKIDAEVINDARAMSQKTDKTMRYCLDKILKDNKNISRTTIASPSEHVPDIAKRTERKRR